MRRALLVAAGYLITATAAGGQAVPKIKFEKYALPNGLEVILHEDHSTPIVSVNTWYKVGSGDEKTGRTGFAHLFEHIMFMGSEHVPVGVFDKELEAAGGDNNGSTTEDRTNYYENLPSNALPLALWLDADRMAADVIVQAITALEIHLKVRQLRNLVDRFDELPAFGFKRVDA